MTPRAIQVLRQMQAAEAAGLYEEAEIVCSGLECWLGSDRISRVTVNKLLVVMAVSEDDNTKGCVRYHLNQSGRALASDPSQISIILEAIANNTPLRVIGSRIVPLNNHEAGHDQ